MFAGIKGKLQDIRYGDMRKKKRWLAGLSIACVAIILVAWAYVFDWDNFISNQDTKSKDQFSSLLEEVAKTFSYAGEAVTAGMGLINNAVPQEQAASSSSTVQGTPPESASSTPSESPAASSQE